MKTIQPSDQPQPKGHYSPGIEHGGLIYVSGQLPMTLDTREPFTGDIGEQTELALRNVEAVLKAASAGDGGEQARRNHLCYAHLYLGLYYVALGEKEKACDALASVGSEFPRATEAKKKAQAEYKRAGC